jgi:cardiolipin hydrolase
MDILTDKQPKQIDLKTLNYARVSLVGPMGYDPSQTGAAPAPLPDAPTPGAYFFPSEESFSRLLDFINSSKKSLEIAIFNFSDDTLSRAVVAAKTRGVNVRVVADDEQTKNQGNDVIKLKQAGLNIRVDNSPYLMHNKFAIVDGQWLETGSFNWTMTARTQNRENIVITSDASLVKAFKAEFEKLWSAFPEMK